MNVRFPLLLLFSAGLHAWILWAIEPARDPVLPLAPGRISVDLVATPALSPSPLQNAPMRQEPRKIPEDETYARQTTKPPPRQRPRALAISDPRPEASVPHPLPEDPQVSPRTVRVIASDLALTSVPLPAQPPVSDPRPVSRIQPEPPAALSSLVEEETVAKRVARATVRRKPDRQRFAKEPPEEIRSPREGPTLPRPTEPVRLAQAAVEKPTPIPSKPSPASLPAVRQAQGVRTQARLLGTEKPSYPRQAHRRGLEGLVVVWLRISPEGNVVEARFHQRSGHPALDEPTLRWAGSLRFQPARRGLTPVPTTVLLPVRYRLIDAF